MYIAQVRFAYFQYYAWKGRYFYNFYHDEKTHQKGNLFDSAGQKLWTYIRVSKDVHQVNHNAKSNYLEYR